MTFKLFKDGELVNVIKASEAFVFGYAEKMGYTYKAEEEPPRTYTPLELTQQDITDRELDTIELGQSMTDLELMIMEGYHV